MKKKKKRLLVIIESIKWENNKKLVSRYTTSKNKINTPNKLKLFKYNKYIKKKSLHIEI